MLSEKNYCEAERLKELKVAMFFHFVFILDFLSIHVFFMRNQEFGPVLKIS